MNPFRSVRNCVSGLLALQVALLACAQPRESTPSAQAPSSPQSSSGQNAKPSEDSGAEAEAAQTAIPVGLGSPLGPPTDPFNDTRTQGYVWGGYRYVPDINAAYVHETNPLKTSAGGPADSALVTYVTLTVRDAQGGPTRLFAGAAQTKWNTVNINPDPRMRVTFDDRYRIGGWQFPVRLSYNQDVVSRSSFLARQVNTELVTRQYSGSVSGVRNFGPNELAVTLVGADVSIGSAFRTDGTNYVSTNSYLRSLMRVKGTHAFSDTTAVYLQTETDRYRYSASGLDEPINPKSDVATSLLGVQKQFSRSWGFSADIGSSTKGSARSDLVPGARHTVGSINGSFNPSAATRSYLSYVVAAAELNDTGISNLLTNTWSVGWSRKLSPVWATNLTYDRTKITANEVTGNVVDSKFFVTLQYKPTPSILASLAVSRTQRQVADLTDLVKPFVSTRYLINLTYYL